MILGLAQRLSAVEAVVEVGVQMMGLVREYRAERATVGVLLQLRTHREAPSARP
jgi:hypothetical protein